MTQPSGDEGKPMTNATSEAEYQTAGTRWAVTWKLICDLWPRWNPTEAQAVQWRRRLSGRYQIGVREAAEEVASERPFLTPRLGWILAVLKGRTPQRDTSARYEFTDEQIAEVVGDDQDMIEELAKLPEGYLRELLVPALTACFMLDRETATLGPDAVHLRHHAQKAAKDFDLEVRRWDPELRGLVWAAWEAASQQPSVAAKGPLRQEVTQHTTVGGTHQAMSTQHSVSSAGRQGRGWSQDPPVGETAPAASSGL